jgi:hypothetical protein
MQEEPHDEKYAIDEFVNKLRAFKTEIEGAKDVYLGQSPELLSDLTGVEDSISLLLDGIEQYNGQSIEDFNDYINRKKSNFE